MSDQYERLPLQICQPFFSRDIILGVLAGRSNEQWITQYGSSHQHPVNRVCTTVGIRPFCSRSLFIASIFFHRLCVTR